MRFMRILVNISTSKNRLRNKMTDTVVITRHASLVEYLKEKGLINDDAIILSHATPENVKDKNVIGVLPHSLSCLTSSFSEIPLNLPAEKRGQELSLDDMRQYAGEMVTYNVQKV